VFKRDVTIYDGDGTAGLNNILVTFTGGWTCQGLTDFYIVDDYGYLTFHFDGTDWFIVGSSA
jgi:hypothetical protein